MSRAIKISLTSLAACILLGMFLFWVLLGFLPCAADADARNEYINRLEQELDMKAEFAARGVTYYGTRGNVNSYYTAILIHTDRPCDLPLAVDAWFRTHPLRMVIRVDQILYSPTGEVSPEIYNTQYYW